MKFIQLKGDRQFFHGAGIILHRLKPSIPYTEELFKKLQIYIVLGYLEVSDTRRSEQHYTDPAKDILNEFGAAAITSNAPLNVARIIEDEEVEVKEEIAKPVKQRKTSKAKSTQSKENDIIN